MCESVLLLRLPRPLQIGALMALAVFGTGARRVVDTSASPHVKFRNVDMDAVRYTDPSQIARSGGSRFVLFRTMPGVTVGPAR